MNTFELIDKYTNNGIPKIDLRSSDHNIAMLNKFETTLPMCLSATMEFIPHITNYCDCQLFKDMKGWRNNDDLTFLCRDENLCINDEWTLCDNMFCHSMLLIVK